MNRPIMNRDDSGFTLLEMLVTLVVLGLLLGGLAAATRFALTANARETAMLSRSGRFAATSRALRRLIEEAEPGGPAGAPHALRMVTRLPLSFAATPDIDATILVDQRHDLVLLWRPHPWGQPLLPLPLPRRETLLRGVASLDVAYWWQKPNTGRPAWYAIGPYGTLPTLIRVKIRFISKTRHWPQLIAAPFVTS